MKAGKKKQNKPILILIVDDVEANLQLLGNILQEQNYDLSFALRGEDALAILETDLPHLILLDIMMPEMDGFEVCKEIKANPRTKDIPIIFLTAKTEIDDIIKGFELGAVDYITKPFNSAELLARVNTHIQLKQTQEELKELNVAMSKFFSIITNDIKDNLVGVKGISNFLVQDIEAKDTENIINFAKMLQSDSTKLYTFLENIVEWATIQTDRIDNMPGSCNLRAIVDKNIVGFDETLKLKNVNVKNNINKDIDLIVDSHLLSAIINKIFSNAIKYSKSNNEILISSKEIDESWIEFTIQDFGVGMEAQVVNKIFRIDTPYVKTTGTGNEGGTGLGLMICKALVDRVNGEITIESVKHQGTIVTVCLPKVAKVLQHNDEDILNMEELDEDSL